MIFDDVPWHEPEEDEHTQPTAFVAAPFVTYKQVTDNGRELFLILDAAKEPIDSTQNAGKVDGLIRHWQKALYGGGSQQAQCRQPGED